MAKPSLPNRHEIDGDIGRLIMTKLDGTQHVALFDAADLDLVMSARWLVTYKGYVQTRRGSAYTELKIRWLHRMILGLTPDDPRVGDHISGNRLDNRRANLRAVTNQRNVANQRIVNHKGSSRFRGVSWDSARERWIAQTTIDYQNHHLGRFDTEEEAATAVAAFREQAGLPAGY